MKSIRFSHGVILAVLGLVFVLCGLERPCPASTLEPTSQRSQEPPHFYADVTYFPSYEQEGTLEIHYDISYSQLLFLKKPDGFLAHFEIQAILSDNKGRQVGGDSWRRQIACSSYKETISPEGSYQETFKLLSPAGKYTLRVKTVDLDSEEESSVLLKLDLKPFKTFPAISDLVIGICNADSSNAPILRSRITPFPRASFGERFPIACAYGEIYDTSAVATGEVRVIWRILDERGAVKMQDTIEVERQGKVSPFLFTFTVDELKMGRHALELFLGQPKGVASATRTFQVDESKFDLSQNIDDTLTLLSYIAPRSEVGPIKSAVGPERERLWLEFWKKRDPNPETPENEFLIQFFDRISYANENFSTIIPGWKTDRGRIYIKRGPPDQIETRPMNATGPAYEIWYYFQKNLTYVFVDRMGLGDFELVGPDRE